MVQVLCSVFIVYCYVYSVYSLSLSIVKFHNRVEEYITAFHITAASKVSPWRRIVMLLYYFHSLSLEHSIIYIVLVSLHKDVSGNERLAYKSIKGFHSKREWCNLHYTSYASVQRKIENFMQLGSVKWKSTAATEETDDQISILCHP